MRLQKGLIMNSNSNELNRVIEKIRSSFISKDHQREIIIRQCRDIIRNSANAIRAIHRRDYDLSRQLIKNTETIIAAINKENQSKHNDLLFTGPLYDAHKEFAEANITLSILASQDLPEPDELGISYAAYLNGLGESMGEIRRYILDSIRRDDFTRCEELLSIMDEIYSVLVTMDFPDAITRNLRRTTDSARGILEKTRGDVTVVIKQKELEKKIHSVIPGMQPD